MGIFSKSRKILRVDSNLLPGRLVLPVRGGEAFGEPHEVLGLPQGLTGGHQRQGADLFGVQLGLGGDHGDFSTILSFFQLSGRTNNKLDEVSGPAMVESL